MEEKDKAGLTLDLAGDIAAAFGEVPKGDLRRQHMLGLLETQSRSEKIAMARMTIRCLVAIAQQDPAGVGKTVMTMVAPSRKRGPAAAKANMQSARVALEVAVATCRLDSMGEAVRHVLLAACASADSNVRSLAIVAVYRLVRVNYPLGLVILQELARRSVWFGLIRPRRLEVFAGCAGGLFLERPHDHRLTADLKPIVEGLISRVWGLNLAVWLIPKVVADLWAAVPDDYNGLNLVEVKGFKEHAAENPELFAAVNRMIDFAEPAHGTSDQFAQALSRLVNHPRLPVINLALGTAMVASVSRALGGDESALEAFYDCWNRLPSDHEAWHGWMYWMRIMQVGRKFQDPNEQPPLGSSWTLRMEDVIRKCMRQHQVGKHQLIHTYVLGGVIPGVVFLAHQQGHGRLRLLEELIEWACSGPEGMLQWPGTPPERQAGALLLRLLEVVGVEFGMSDHVSRETVFHGISCFLGHASKFDDFLWICLATILVRMRIWTPDEVTDFLDQVGSEHREALQMRMNRILPREGVGSLLSQHHVEPYWAVLLSEPAGKQDGLRKEWQEFIRRFFGPTPMAAAMRYGVQRLIQSVRQ